MKKISRKEFEVAARLADMDVNKMSVRDFDMVPHRRFDEDLVFDSMVILPGGGKKLHDSGYRCMDFVAVRDGRPICRLSGCSDALHIDGIGGARFLDRRQGADSSKVPGNWSMDCLPESGLLHLWSMDTKMTCGQALSSFEVFAVKKEKANAK